MQIVNFEIAKHPINWVTIFLMLLIGSIAFHFILKWGSSGSDSTL